MPSPPILGMYQSNGAFPTPGPSAWPSGPTTNLGADYFAWYSGWQSDAASFITKCINNSLIPFVELEPWYQDSSGTVHAILFSDITSGAHDSELTALGSSIAATGKPVILTFGHEMNVSGQYPWSQGDTGSGPGGGTLTPAEWQAGWKYVHDKVNSTANGQAIWMWACSAWTGGTTIDPSPWWPGASYVDAVGIDGYPNTQYGASLGTFAGQIQQTVTAIRNLGWTDPIFLAETNLAQMVASGGQSITAFVAAMYTAGVSGILEFEDASWGLPKMTAAQWNEYNTAISANYGTPPGGGGGGTSGNKIGGLTDAFSGSTLDTSKWYLEPDQPTGNPSGTYTIAGNKLNLSGGDYSDTGYYTSVNSQNHYDLTGSAAFCQLFPNTSNADYDTGFGVFAGDFSNGLAIGVTGGNLYVQKTSSGSYTTLHSVTYNATSHAWVRIREGSGTIYFETSPDSQAWTVQYSTTTETVNAWTATTSYIQCYYGSTSGSAKPSGVGSFAAFNGGTVSSGSSSGGTFAPVGQFIQTTGTSFSWTPTTVGNTLAVIAFSTTAGAPVTGVSSTNATWAQIVPDQTLGTTTVTEATAFLGTATKPTPAVVNLATTATAGNLRVLAREFDSNGLPVALDSFVTMNGDAAGAVTAWPSVTPTKGGEELLFGFERNFGNVGGAAVAGSTPNTSYSVDAQSNGGAFDLSVSSPTAISWGDNDSRSVLVLLLYAQSSSGNTGGGTGGTGGTGGAGGLTYWYDNAVITGLNAKAALLNGGTIQLYTGAQPALNGALTGTLLVTLTFSATAFASALASGGTVTAAANAITSGTAVATGTVGYFALVTSSGQTVLTGSVGDGSVSGADLVIPGLAVASGTTIACSAFSLTQSETGN